MPLKSISEDAASRRPVWLALSDMFLDTDTSLSRDWRVKELARSPYSLAELEEILVCEVYPACRSNLFCVAGEWAGFDLDWLEDKIRRRSNSPFKFLHAISLGRITVPASIEWRATKNGLQARRGLRRQTAA